MHELAQKGEAVHPGHFNIKGEYIGFQFYNHIARNKWVGGGTLYLDFGATGKLAIKNVPDDC